MKKGFTLIELLAVIVILAIIALIATPIILGIINDAREQAKHRTAELIAKEVELAYTSYLFNGNGVGDVSNFCEYMKADYFAMDNGKIEGTCTHSSVTVKSGNDSYTVNYTDGIAKVLYGEEEYAKVPLKGNSDLTYIQVYKPKYYGDYSFLGAVGNTSAPASPLKEPPTGKDFYIGYDVAAGKVSVTYVCFKRNNKEYCLKGKDSMAYDQNKEIVAAAFSDVAGTDSCPFGDVSSSCTVVDDLSVHVNLNGFVDVGDDNSVCSVDVHGSFGCYE